MNWQRHWDQLALKAHPQEQVARTGGGSPVAEATLTQITQDIVQKLALKQTDRVLDICCGNGALSVRIAENCRELWGVDLSPQQIERAQQYQRPGLNFVVGNAAALPPGLTGTFDKILLYFSFQYLDTPTLARRTIQGMAQMLSPGGTILIGDVPQREKLAVFYPRLTDRIRYQLQLVLGRSPMGRFWSLAEMEGFAQEVGLTLEQVPQATSLPYAHYRCDYLLRHRRP